MERDEPFPARVAAPDRRAFAEQIFDRHAQQIYRYVLAWTAEGDVARELTVQVLRTAVKRMERLSEPGTDTEARLVALARAAVARRAEALSSDPGSGPLVRNAGVFTPSEPVPLLLDTVARLDDGRRDVVILRQLLGHSVDHAARLLAFDPPVVEELERSAYATLWRRLNHAQDTQAVSTWDALTVAAALRQGAQSWLALPDDEVMAGLREQVVEEPDPGSQGAAATAPRQAGEWRRRLAAALGALTARHRWLLAGCAASAIVGMVAALTIGQAGQSSSCGRSGTCLTPTTQSAFESGPTLRSLPSEQSIVVPTSTTRAADAPAFPALTSDTSQTTGPAASTTTMPGGVSTTLTTRPQRTTTITTARSTTSSTDTTTTTTIDNGPPTT